MGLVLLARSRLRLGCCNNYYIESRKHNIYVATMDSLSFSQQLTTTDGLTTAERRVVDYLGKNREAALLASGAELARAIGTSDATVIRTARRLGFDGLDGLRRALAGDLKRDLSLSDRVDNSLARVDGGAVDALGQTIETLRNTLDGLENIPTGDFERTIEILQSAARIHVFGIGPSGHIAGYFAAQLARMGRDALAIRNTGLQLADDLVRIGPGDALVALAYDLPYPEVTALFDHVVSLSLPSVLITSPGPVLPDYRAGLTLRVARGRADGFGLHAGTLALIEALLVAFAAGNRDAVRTSLGTLNRARSRLSDHEMGL
jgi:DNA-binding MurR/RpiR family transcriptional regulator